MKTLTFVGADVAPTNYCNLIETTLVDQTTIHINMIVGGGKPITVSDAEIANTVRGSDLLVLGLSSQKECVEKELVAAREAISFGISYGFYSDMALCSFRPWLQGELAQNASFLIGLLPEDTKKLRLMYPKARFLNTGNPFRGDMAFPKFTRNVVREKLGVKDTEKLIIASGTKFAAGNFQIWGLLLEALELSDYQEEVVVMIAPHPGDSTLRAIDNATGKTLPLYTDMLRETSVRTIYQGMPTPDAVAGADLVIDFTGDTSVRSAYLRVPLINVTTTALLKRFERETGSDEIETVMNGAGFKLPNFSASCLRESIESILNNEGDTAIKLLNKQATAYPIPTDRNASRDASIMALCRLLGV